MAPQVSSFDEDATLFVYGSLLDEARRTALLGRRVATMSATLRGYARGRARYFHVTAEPRAMTEGLLLLELGTRDLIELDRYEEVPLLYTREKIAVEDGAGRPRRCWIYLPTARTLRGL